jgi:hypothetical protein
MKWEKQFDFRGLICVAEEADEKESAERLWQICEEMTDTIFSNGGQK